MKRPRLTTLVLVAMSICAAAGSGCAAERSPGTTLTSAVRNDYITDVSDQRRLAGISDSIFVGEVTEQSGTRALDATPETQFRVRVIDSLKGDLAGTVVVNQQGGTTADGKQLVLVDNDPLVEVGKNYIFSTRVLHTENWHTLVPNFGKIELTEQEATAVEENSQSRRDSPEPEEVSRMRDSIANEIGYER